MEISRIVQAVLKVRDWTQEQLAERLRTNQNNISRWLDGVEPRGAVRDQILALARESGVIEDEHAARTGVPIMGYIGAGAEIEPDYEQVPPDGLDQVELALALPANAIGLQVRGDSMLPQYNEGTVIVVHREQTRSTTSMIGEEVAVRTHDGRRFLKRLMPGAKPRTYNLESFNARPIVGVRIVWASEIIAMIPARQIRPVRSRAQKRSAPRPTGKRGGG